jgi:hypothetical protein
MHLCSPHTVQVATAEWDVQKPKVIIAKKELTAVLLSFDPFRNVRVCAECMLRLTG